MVVAKECEIFSDHLFDKALSYLVINSSFVSDLGLFHGKTGCVLFFSYYAHYSGNKLFEDFSFDLLNEIYQDIYKDILINFENGLCGIGWTIEFLVQNGFMEGDTDEILADIDKRVMEYDIRHISDLRFRSGLIGIVFYICARLSAVRVKNDLPFDLEYLENLRDVLLNVDFSEKDELPPCLIETYMNALNGIKPEKTKLPSIINWGESEIPDNFQYISLGLIDGLAGILLRLIVDKMQLSNEDKSFSLKKDGLIIFNEESRATNYGIGTYIGLLTDVMKNYLREVVIVHLRSHKVNSISVEKENNITQIYIADSQCIGCKYDLKKQNELYYRNILLLLYPFLLKIENHIFHLNYMRMERLALLLKERFIQSKIAVTVHYTCWSFALLGDKNKLQKVIDNPDNEKYEQLYKNIESEKQLLNICDQVISIAEHSYDDLINIYKIPKCKIALVPHGLKDCYFHMTKKEQRMLRKKYGFKEREMILVFAGRLDMIKGIEILAETFIELQKEYPQLRLIIAGDGSYNMIFSKLIYRWSKVVFTGFVDKAILYELFSISDIGVLPSFHEEFGYVALEMMMMGLPLVVSETTGLSELVVDRVSGVTASLNIDEREKNISVLYTAIKELLDNSLLREQYAKNGRLRYLQNYSFEKFEKQTKACLK